jgi:hypothetical protein
VQALQAPLTRQQAHGPTPEHGESSRDP